MQLKAVRRSDTEILKKVLHAGLNKELKHMSVYQCDKSDSYNEFNIIKCVFTLTLTPTIHCSISVCLKLDEVSLCNA